MLNLTTMDEQVKTKCECKECGKTWNKGEQDDNETICLRCEALSIIKQDDIDNYDYE